MPSNDNSEPQNKKKSSFATAQLNILGTVHFKQPISLPNTIIFLHIPKTGGTNLHFLVEAWAKADSTFKPYRFAVPERTNGQGGSKIVKNWQGALKTAEEALSKKSDCCEDKHFISGHFPFGLHTHIKRTTGYITLLREPVAQQLSAFYFACQRGHAIQEMLETYLGECLDNPQTRLLAGKKHMDGACTAAILEKAKQNIEEHFLLAGVTEDTDAFIQIFAAMQNRDPLALCRAQVTGEKREILPSEAFQKVLAEKHQFDMQLYQWVKKRWYEWKKNNVCEVPVPIIQDEKILCLKPQFASTRLPEWCTIDEIETYNASVSREGLVAIQQNHSGVSTITFEKAEQIVNMLKDLIPNMNKTEEPARLVLEYLYASHEITKPIGSESSNQTVKDDATKKQLSIL